MMSGVHAGVRSLVASCVTFISNGCSIISLAEEKRGTAYPHVPSHRPEIRQKVGLTFS